MLGNPMLFLPYQINIFSLFPQLPVHWSSMCSWYFLANNVQPRRDDIFHYKLAAKNAVFFDALQKHNEWRGIPRTGYKHSFHEMKVNYGKFQWNDVEVEVEIQGFPRNITSFRWRTSARATSSSEGVIRESARLKGELACRLLSMATPQRSW